MAAISLAGRRVLLVEDEMLVSLLLEDLLAEHRCVVIGPFDTVPSALEAARTETLDLAVLDVNVAGMKVYPVAEMLHSRGIPFVLVSGYGRSAVPDQHPDWAVCSKPFRESDLVGTMQAQLAIRAQA